MILSICIPTLNRVKYLEANLKQLISIIDQLDFQNQIELVVSDNCSDDDTPTFLERFKTQYSSNYNLSFWRQPKRLIMQESLLFVVSKAKATHFMWLGDDDYINSGYLLNAVNAITNQNVSCIIPSYKFIDQDNNPLIGGRDLRLKNTVYKASYYNCLKNSWRGHQLSGLVTKTEVLEQYRKHKVDNIYPCIFFSAIGCLTYKTLHLTENPINVTLVTQDKKAWGYGNDGLFNDIFDNYNKLPINPVNKGVLQLHFFYVQYWRLWAYKKLGAKAFVAAFFNILKTRNSMFLFKLIYPLLVLIRMVDVPTKKLIKNMIIKLGLFKR